VKEKAENPRPARRSFGGLLRRELALLAGVATLLLFTYALPGPAVVPAYVGPFLFAWLFGVMLWGAFTVVRHADALAEILGEPYGTLILTISVVGIEVSLIAAIMLSGESSPTLARDTMFAVLMIVLNGLIGLALMIGALRHHEQHYNIDGANAFLALLVPLSLFALVLPAFTVTTATPTFSPAQAVFFSLVIALLYAVFLGIQTVRHSGYFVQPPAGDAAVVADHHHDELHATYPTWVHGVLLLAALLPIVLLSKHLAGYIDLGIVAMELPVALGGVLIALLILSAEGISAVKAAWRNQPQRSVNLCLGAAVSTIGMTVPAVLVISLVIDQPVDLGLSSVEMVLLAATLLTSILTFGSGRTNVLQGAVHLVLFLAYVALIFSP